MVSRGKVSKSAVRAVSTFHTRTVVSSEAEARCILSGDQDKSEQPFVCPAKFLIISPVSGDQIFTRVSSAGTCGQYYQCCGAGLTTYRRWRGVDRQG